MAQSTLGLLFAGYETSSVALTYILYLLSQHPEDEAKCLEEVQRFRGNKSDADDPSSPTFVYLDAVL
jgi:cytochrome P450 family 3 subfamily A